MIDKGLISFYYIWISNFPSNICWQCYFSQVYVFWHLCQLSHNCNYMYLFYVFYFFHCSVCLFWTIQFLNGKSSCIVLFVLNYIVSLGPFCGSMCILEGFFLIFVMILVGILTRSTLDLWIDFDEIVTFTNINSTYSGAWMIFFHCLV